MNIKIMIDFIIGQFSGFIAGGIVALIHLMIGFLNDAFWQNTIANFLGTIAGGILLYLCLEKRINDNIKKHEKKNYLSNLKSDLIYNYIFAERILKKMDYMMNSDTFLTTTYHEKGISAFLYTRPIRDEKFYFKLSGLLHDFEGNNRRLNVIFSSHEPETILDNKKRAIADSEKIIGKISAFLTEYEKYLKNSE